MANAGDLRVHSIGRCRSFLTGLLSAAATAAVAPVAAQETPVAARIGKTFEESVQAPMPVDRRARAGAPNVLVWMIDDLGFAQIGSYGGLVDTPNLDRLAKQGLRYANYHTAPICSASRAAFLTGRNPHTVHVGGHSISAVGFPGQDARVPREAGTVAENLRQAGYITYAIGKWDHRPAEHASAAGPFTYWPSGQGFDRFYGFLNFDTDNFAPQLWSDHQPLPLRTEPNYHLTADMADKAIGYIASRDAAIERPPFFMYWATGAVHAPHHAPDAYLKRYRGRFDMGWDKAREEILRRQKALGLVPADVKMPPRPEGMPAWDSLSADHRRLYARAMEAFAAQLTHADEQFGRILAALEARGELANTLVMVTSDNGASAEGAEDGTFSELYTSNGYFPTVDENLRFYEGWGGPTTYPNYPMGWAVAGNTPFRFYKQSAHEGGSRVPLIVAWPQGIAARGELRSQFHHVSDLTPTILQSARVEPAPEVNGRKQMPFDGLSMTYSYTAPTAPSPKKVQYLEMYGNRAIWADGWKAVIPHRTKTWDFTIQPPITDNGWELYDTRHDFNEMNDLAASQPARLKRMLALFDQEARRYNVYPLTNTGAAQKSIREASDRAMRARGGLWTYDGPVSNIPERTAPPIHLRSFSMTAKLTSSVPAKGVVMAMGGRLGGMSLYVLDGRPVFGYQSLDQLPSRIAASSRLPAGASELGLEFTRQGRESARIRLTVNGKEVATGEVRGKLSTFLLSATETFDVGSDEGTAPSSDYLGPFPFTGRIEQVQFKVRDGVGQ